MGAQISKDFTDFPADPRVFRCEPEREGPLFWLASKILVNESDSEAADFVF